jgi:hypothetical protein
VHANTRAHAQHPRPSDHGFFILPANEKTRRGAWSVTLNRLSEGNSNEGTGAELRAGTRLLFAAVIDDPLCFF